jgi:hypothetical protein
MEVRKRAPFLGYKYRMCDYSNCFDSFGFEEEERRFGMKVVRGVFGTWV